MVFRVSLKICVRHEVGAGAGREQVKMAAWGTKKLLRRHRSGGALGIERWGMKRFVLTWMLRRKTETRVVTVCLG